MCNIPEVFLLFTIILNYIILQTYKKYIVITNTHVPNMKHEHILTLGVLIIGNFRPLWRSRLELYFAPFLHLFSRAHLGFLKDGPRLLQDRSVSEANRRATQHHYQDCVPFLDGLHNQAVSLTLLPFASQMFSFSLAWDTFPDSKR